MTSVVIAAHNEASVIGRCLDSLLRGARPDEFDITVVANGCTDDTARVAAQWPVRVLELGAASKPIALNAGDAVAVGFPRVYLDADIVLTTAGLREVAAAASGPGGAPAAVPRRELDVAGRPLLVRAYFAINGRLPVFRDGLFGRGVIALSAEGRGRFDTFPEMVADDLFLDSLFARDERKQVESVTARVATPRRTGDLLRRLVRVRRGNAVMRAAAGSGQVPVSVRQTARGSWLRDVVVPRPWLAPAAAVYVGITVLAALRARRAPSDDAWGRDESSRVAAPTTRGSNG